MVLLVWGVNFQTAPLELREKLATLVKGQKSLIENLMCRGIIAEGLLISTCNRTEIYAVSRNSQAIMNDLIEEQAALQDHAYLYYESQAVHHLMRVACGIDSMIIGEVEILGQLKQAFREAHDKQYLGKYLTRMFQKTFHAAKMVRTQTKIGINPISVASTAVKLAERIFTNLEEKTVLFVGAGDLIRLLAEHLKNSRLKKCLFTNRTLSHAEKIAQKVSGEVIPLESMAERLHEVDIVITGVYSPLPMIGKGMVECALQKRKRRPMLMIDLSIPRAIEPQLSMLEDIYLYCIDDLKTMVEAHRKQREEAVADAERIIIQESQAYMVWREAQETLKTLKNFRNKFETLRDSLLKEAVDQLDKGLEARVVIKTYSEKLFNRLLHPPTERLRKAGFAKEQAFLKFTRELFELNSETLEIQDETIHQ